MRTPFFDILAINLLNSEVFLPSEKADGHRSHPPIEFNNDAYRSRHMFESC